MERTRLFLATTFQTQDTVLQARLRVHRFDPLQPPVDVLHCAGRAPANLRPEFPLFLAEIDGTAVAMATLFIHDGLAFLGNANTLSRFRGRGCQQALIEHRLREAARLGCDAASSDTAFGTISHRNTERAGLALIYQSVDWQRSGKLS